MVPDVPSFDVDDGFSYAVPDTLGPVPIGSIVRVPLGGRKVRGWVVSTRPDAGPPGRRLRPILSRSGDSPIFDEALLTVLRWAAAHYVAPLAVLLPRAGPPNLPRGKREGSRPADLAGVARRSAFVAGSGPWSEVLGAAADPVLAAEGTVLVVVATVVEAERLAAQLQKRFGDRVLRAWSSLPAAEATRSWVRAGGDGALLVGTRETALWHLPPLTHALVIEPGRRALKAKQTPTINARDVLRKRASVERFALTYAGAVPPGELVAAGTPIERAGARRWPIVEVVSRAEEGPGAPIVLERTRAAIRGPVAQEGRVCVQVPHRGYAPALRCAACGELRRCVSCGSGPDRGDHCRRCGADTGSCVKCGGSRFQALGVAVGRVVDDLARSLGRDVAAAGTDAPVTVGTERDLPAPGSRDLAVAVAPERLWLAPHYRAEEEALRVLARVAATVRRGRGRRCVVQTADPDHRVVAAIRSGDGTSLIEQLVSERSAVGFPPGGELIAVEVRGEPTVVHRELELVVDDAADLYGPADSGDRSRWLVQGPS
ncbi:MAG: hypothetical protein ACE5GC_10135, partial [Acidimicrobiia bacterium]